MFKLLLVKGTLSGEEKIPSRTIINSLQTAFINSDFFLDTQLLEIGKNPYKDWNYNAFSKIKVGLGMLLRTPLGPSVL